MQVEMNDKALECAMIGDIWVGGVITSSTRDQSSELRLLHAAPIA